MLGHALLRVVLPGLAMILGVTFVVMGAFSVRAEPLLRIALVLGGGAGGVCGFLSLLWSIRMRFSDDPAVRAVSAVRSDVAAGALFVVLGIVGLGGVMQALRADFGPAQAFDARLDRLDTFRSLRRGGEAHLHLQGVRPALGWHCTLDCSALGDLRRLPNTPGLPVHVTKIGDSLIGLAVQGQEFLWVEAERDRLKTTHALAGLAFAAMTVGAGIYATWRHRTGYRPSPQPVGPDYRVLLRNRLTKAGKVQP